jgi:plastocyanin
MGRIRHLVVAGAVVATLVGQAMPASASVLVRAKCNFWSPSTVKVAKGTKVVWKSVCASHTVTSYSKNWSKNVVLNQGQTTSRTFKSKGVFKFRCRFHSTLSNGVCHGMCDRVRVG